MIPKLHKRYGTRKCYYYRGATYHEVQAGPFVFQVMRKGFKTIKNVSGPRVAVWRDKFWR